MALTEVSSAKSFGGLQKVYSHESKELQCKMKFQVYLPPKAVAGERLPVMYYLSGLTCTEENFMIKSGFQRYAAENDLIVVGPDTSPRGVEIEGQDDSWDFGSGAGFYVDATEEKWSKHYRMYSYVTKELPELVEKELSVLPNCRSICGHSMGGHGALICALKNPGMYKAVSAFAPISNPSECPWGVKAFTGYLGPDKENWKPYDATHLVQKYDGPQLEIVIDTGDADPWFKQGQLLPENLIAAARSSSNVKVQSSMREGYDHGYFFVGTYIEDHIKYHASLLRS